MSHVLSYPTCLVHNVLSFPQVPRALRTLMLYVPRAPRALVARVPFVCRVLCTYKYFMYLCPMCIMPCVLSCFTRLISCVFSCPTYQLPCLVLCLRCLVSFVLSCFMSTFPLRNPKCLVSCVLTFCSLEFPCFILLFLFFCSFPTCNLFGGIC